jgi:type IV fimbrial biogenesis protein FimT
MTVRCAVRIEPCERPRGFSLVELLVTLSVLSVLAALAAPQLGGPLSENRIRVVAREFADSLSFSRSEASKRGTRVVMCPRSTAANTCQADASHWNQGWIVYADADRSGNYGDADVLLSVRSPVPPGIDVGSGQAAPIGVLPSGEMSFAAGVSRTIRIAGGDRRRYVVVSRVGRPSVLEAAQCTDALQCSP